MTDRKAKYIYHYADVTGDPVKINAIQVNAYLIDAPMIFIEKRSHPICNVPSMTKGSSPTDDGNFLLTEEEKNTILKQDKSLKKLIRPFVGAKEYLHNIPRYCIWLKDIPPLQYTHSKEIMDRVKKIKSFRLKSDRVSTQKYADFPGLFVEIRQPDTDYLLVPRVSSERRKYIPIGFVSKDVICGDQNMLIPNATLYEFGVVTSGMHMAWMRYVCGRLKSDYRYSNTIVYNNFPWPNPTDRQKQAIEEAAQAVLDVRKLYPEMSLAALYDTTAILPELLKAHQKLDKTIEKAYGRVFDDDARRVAYLFELDQTLSGELFLEEKKRG
jgi:hypothetical protein